MKLPTISQYLESVENPQGLLRTLGGFAVERDCYRRAVVCAGRSAAVFKVRMEDGTARFIKCYLKAPKYAKQLYDYINSQAVECPILAPAEYLEREIYVFDHRGQGEYYDVASGPWVEGETLENALRRAAMTGDQPSLVRLAEGFDSLARMLLDQQWAHGDLKPENIIVASDGGMTLIDCDAMFIPPFAGNPTPEIGSKPYQHPLRDTAMFDKHIDDYPVALISVSLHALALQPELYAMYNRGDGIILSPGEVVGERSPLQARLLRLWESLGDRRMYTLTRMLASPTPYLEGLRKVMETLPASTPAGELHLVERQGKWGFSDGDGNVAIPALYDEAMEFSEDLAAIRLGASWHFIDLSGDVVINCAGYAKVKPFHEGLAAMESDGRWGYMDKRGTIVIPPRFEVACNMSESAAAVREGKKYGYIDPSGQWIIPPQFDTASGFRSGEALATRGRRRMVINRRGEVLEEA